MRKFACIVNNKVHIIEEHDMTLEELGEQIYNLNQVQYVDITDVDPVPEVGWDYDGVNFSAPLPQVDLPPPGPTLEERLTALELSNQILDDTIGVILEDIIPSLMP